MERLSGGAYAPLSDAEERKWIKRFAALKLVNAAKRTLNGLN